MLATDYVYSTSQILIILPRICDFASCQFLLYVTLFFVLLVCLCILFFCCFVINHLLHLNQALFSYISIAHCLGHSVVVKFTGVFYIREIFMMRPQRRHNQCYLFLFTMSFISLTQNNSGFLILTGYYLWYQNSSYTNWLFASQVKLVTVNQNEMWPLVLR